MRATITAALLLSLVLCCLPVHANPPRHLAAAAAAAAAAWSATFAAAQQQHSTQGNCTPARSKFDASRPFCFVPETASEQARQFLSAAAASGPTGFGGGGNHSTTEVNRLRQFFYLSSINGSRAAQQQFLQATRNDSIAGVPVVFGVTKGVNESSSSNGTRLLIYLHGGGERGSKELKTACCNTTCTHTSICVSP
jgi:hypothetical protein